MSASSGKAQSEIEGHEQEVVRIGHRRRLLGDDPVRASARLGRPCPDSIEASGIRIASLNGVTCSTSWLWYMVIMLVSRAMTIEMPTDEPMLRISVHSAAPSVRSSPGRLAKAMVLSGTKMKPSPNPCAIELIAIVWAGHVERPADHHARATPVARTRPMKMRRRGSTLPLRRPTRNIATNVPMPRVPSR